MKHATKLPSRATAASAGIPAHRLSHGVAKAPPRKIRIVHLLAPEIIKTEARHFRELVQRLTGKPSSNGADTAAASSEDTSLSSPLGSFDTASDGGFAAGSAAVIKAEVKEEAESSSSGGGYLRDLGMEDGSNDSFFQNLENILFSPCIMDANVDGFSV